MANNQISLFLESQRLMNEITANLVKENAILKSQLLESEARREEFAECFDAAVKEQTRLEVCVQQLKNDNFDLSEEAGASKAKSRTLSERLTQSEEERRSLEADAEENRRESENRERKLAEMEQMNEALQERLEAREGEVAALEEKNAEMAERLASAEERLSAAFIVDVVKSRATTPENPRKRPASPFKYSLASVKEEPEDPYFKRFKMEEERCDEPEDASTSSESSSTDEVTLEDALMDLFAAAEESEIPTNLVNAECAL